MTDVLVGFFCLESIRERFTHFLFWTISTLVGFFYTVFHDIILKGAWFTMDKIKSFKQKEKQIVIFQRVKI